MSVDLFIFLGHKFKKSQINNVPHLLNEYFVPHIDKLKLRIGYESAGIVEEINGQLQWCQTGDDEFELQDYDYDRITISESESYLHHIFGE